MNQSEKGYFKKFAMAFGRQDSNSIRIFDAINKQEEYDEESILTKEKITPALFSVLKNQLYSLILQGLEYYLENSPKETPFDRSKLTPLFRSKVTPPIFD